MKRFLAVYFGTDASMNAWKALDEAERQKREAAGMQAWTRWLETHKDAIVEVGSPLGKTLRTSKSGVEKFKNELCAFTVVQAESHEQAAKLFEGHPHFTQFPGESIQIMECLPIP
ncbi:hypothetical protein [Dyella flagellata]|uniref:YCII-related domain-containing protein n=1 Tax=Dyella flagellata TaxID=1867833 RepID=A0ABQ5X9R4_9GAMM|nr:hypothetical protein [Dyella flagellata]GLQ88364.1 hypothetical protein GCM10007898_19330 [Dyella flagellata]